jgi:DNA-binding beta-propeller fold protein YncE
MPASPAPITGRVVNLPGVTDLVYDSVTERIYASVEGNPGRIVSIDPVTGATEAFIAVGINPVKLALSDNGQFLYVGLDGEPAVQRIDMAARAVSLRFTVGSDSFFGPFFVEDMQVLPGNPQALAASLKNKGISPRHAGVTIFDNGVPRAKSTQRHTGSNVIEFSASAATLYGYNNETTGFDFFTMTVDATGLTTTAVVDSFDADFISGFGVDIRFAGDRIYTTTGRVIDPTLPAVVGRVALPSTFGNLVLPDAALGRVFFLSGDFFGSASSIFAFDTGSLPPVPLARQDISGVSGGAASFIRWGAKGLAFRTGGGQVILIDERSLIP